MSLFHAIFDPKLSAEESEAAREEAHQKISAALESVPTLDADKLLRRFVKVIEATKRTNYYAAGHALGFKLAPNEIDFAPFPRPKHEFWVYSPRVEGVHFRFAPSPVAACAGRTAAKTSAPRCWAWSRRRW
nr:NAD-glutamate dehydrogenase domain-containing protein [Arthrobacter sp. JCM 19049]